MEPAATYCGLAARARDEFDDALDYYWKSIGLVEKELKAELTKLDAYFPLSGDEEKDKDSLRLRKIRWEFNHRRITGTFPYLISVGNLYSCASLFETYCLLLCKEIELSTNHDLRSCPGKGMERVFRFLRLVGVAIDDIRYKEEITSILQLRNCAYHANGLLAFSNNEVRIREIVKSRLYYPPVNMAGKRREELDDQVMIVDTGLGDQLQFTNLFAWHACYKFRDFFCDVYARLRETGLVSSSSEIRTDVELPLSEIAVFNGPGGED